MTRLALGLPGFPGLFGYAAAFRLKGILGALGLVVLSLSTLGLSACTPDSPGDEALEPSSFDLLRSIERGEYSVAFAAAEGVSLPDTPRSREVTADYERRSAVVLPQGAWSWTGPVPRGGHLVVGAAPVDAAGGYAEGGDGTVELIVTVTYLGTSEVVQVARSRPQAPGWVDVVVDLERWARRDVTISVEASSSTGQVAFGPARISAGVRQQGPPNVLVILVDTLRADHMSVYGYDRDTTLGIQRTLADRGVTFESAYSQAPWTLPSMVSMYTGRYPGEVLGPTMPDYRLPSSIQSLPEHFQALGYETGAFYANPVLFHRAGFDRGFDTVFLPPPKLETWLNRHADDLNRRVHPWIESNRDRPFFAWAHYIDPHDPYINPDMVNMRSPYYPDYSGNLTGLMVHGLYALVHRLENPQEDVAHLRALYDSEVTYVDRWVANLLDSLEPELLRNTLVVLTSDHGEELYERGGWKHGHTLYEEQIKVPLIFRWDGQIPEGRRLQGIAQLLDLAPTLASAVGAQADPGWQGVDLMPMLRGEQELPRRAAFAQHLATGPLRAAAILDEQKLMLFNHRRPYEPPDRLHARLWSLDVERMAPVEVYDLASDSEERRNRAARPEGRESSQTLAPLIHQRLEPRLPGLRVIPSRIPNGARLSLRLRFSEAPAGWMPYFLADGDTVSLEGEEVIATFVGGSSLGAPIAPSRGLRVVGDFVALESVEARLDGVPVEAQGAIQVAGRPWTGGTVPAPRLRAPEWPLAGAQGEGVRVDLWLPALPAEEISSPELDADREERRRSLQAIGYLGGAP
ncbi:MAG: sulfatase [Acidobacteriota bacterium]